MIKYAWRVYPFQLLKRHPIEEVLADAGYDTNEARLLVARKLGTMPFIPLQTRKSRGSTESERKGRRRLLACRFYAKNSIRRFWVEPDSEMFDREYDARTFSEQAFSVGKGSLRLDSLMHRGREWATTH